jgi:hypothetical protein
VAHGDAVRASDWKGEAVMEANDGELGSRRRSGERWRSEQGKLVGKEVCNCRDVC